MPHRNYVVTTYFKNDHGWVVTHAYGPYSFTDAKKIRAHLIREHGSNGHAEGGEFHVSANKIIDTEAWEADDDPHPLAVATSGRRGRPSAATG